MKRSQAKKYGAARETDQRRRRSTGSFFHSSGKDDDLDLFKEVQRKRRENFFLRPIDDIDDAIRKSSSTTNYGPYSDFIGGFLPSRGVESDLLNEEGEKSDYDWLLTPPETPLFSSLDDEMSPAREGPRTSMISNIEKNKRNIRNTSSAYSSSSSLHHGRTIEERTRRLSLSPQPISTNKARVTRVTPSWRPHTPPTNPSRSMPRTSFRLSKRSRNSFGSSKAGGASSNIRGNSLSPESRIRSSHFHGFSSVSPPNLQIPAARSIKWSSPASNINKHFKSRIDSASITSLSSHEDHLTSHGRDSEAFSAADDLDCMQSISVDISEKLSSTQVISSKKLSMASSEIRCEDEDDVLSKNIKLDSHDDAHNKGDVFQHVSGDERMASMACSSDGSIEHIMDASCENVLAKPSSVCRGKASLTLEEATEVILFCNSIARDLAYQAATIAVDKETFCQCEGSRSTLPLVGCSNSEFDRTPACRKRSRRWLSRPLRSWKKKVNTEVKIALDNTNSQSSTERSAQDFDVEVHAVHSDKINARKPLEMECRCSCSIM